MVGVPEIAITDPLIVPRLLVPPGKLPETDTAPCIFNNAGKLIEAVTVGEPDKVTTPATFCMAGRLLTITVGVPDIAIVPCTGNIDPPNGETVWLTGKVT